ncbi:MAG: hypothetical protein AB2813_13540, partial [Candidatus Sedimenticola endophacoides]
MLTPPLQDQALEIDEVFDGEAARPELGGQGLTRPRQQPQVCRYLVKDFGTSQSPKSTRQRDSRYCP